VQKLALARRWHYIAKSTAMKKTIILNLLLLAISYMVVIVIATYK